MDKHKKNMDDFFRENLSDFELSTKEGNWKLLNHLLNEQEKKRRKRKLFFLIFCVLILLTTGLYILLPEFNSIKTAKNKNVKSNTNHSFENNSIHSKSQTTTTINKYDKAIVNKNHDVKIKTENSASDRSLANNLHTIALDINDSDIKDTNSSNTMPAAVIQTDSNSVSLQNNTTGVDSGLTEFDQHSIYINPPANQSTSEVTTSIKVASAQNNNDSLFVSDFTDKKPVVGDSLSTTTALLSVADSSTKKPDTQNHSFINLNFYAGINIYSTSQSFNSEANISPIAGLEFAPAINSKLSIGLACLYSLQGGYHLYDTATTTEKTYFLDVSESITEQTVQTHHLHKLYFPLSIYYAVAKRHSVSAAIQLSYLVNTKSNYAESYTTAGITNQSQKKNVKGYMDGIKPTTVSVSAGYQFSLSKTLALSGRITRELTSSYISDYFSGVNTNPSWSYQTFLIVKF